jgi:excisionase family DNA binding protein
MTQQRPLGLLTTTEAAQRVGVSYYTVRGWIISGALPTVRINGRQRIRPADLTTAQATAHLGTVVPAWRQDRRHAGSCLRMLREAAGLTQLELAAASGLRHETLSRLELGQQAASAESVRALAHALRVTPERFVSRDPGGVTMLPVAEAAARLGVPVKRLRTWLKAGVLAGSKVSRQWRVPAIAVAELGRSGRLRGRSRRLAPRSRAEAAP